MRTEPSLGDGGERCPPKCVNSPRYTGPERRIPFDHRLLLVVLACVYLPLFTVAAWCYLERA